MDDCGRRVLCGFDNALTLSIEELQRSGNGENGRWKCGGEDGRASPIPEEGVWVRYHFTD